jgi:hypothetical protein
MGQLEIDKLDNAVALIFMYDIEEEPMGHGSGFIIDKNGTLVTNYHVVENAYTLIVRLEINGELMDFEVEKVISGNRDKDLATVLLKNPDRIKLPFLRISKNLPKKGDDCWTISTPLKEDFMNSVTEGIVSNMYPDGVGNWLGYTLQVSAPFSGGSSGGALLNSVGEVIGVTCGGNEHESGARANINFAIWIGELEGMPSINKPTAMDITDYYNSQLSRTSGIFLGDFVGSKMNDEKFLEYYSECTELRIKMFGEDQAELPFIYAYIGLWYYELANFTMALKWILRSLEMLQKFNEESMLEVLKNPRQCVIAFKLAACYERTNDLNKALQFYLQAAINNEENFGLSDQKTKAAMRKARELAEDLNRQSELPDWMTSN